eukprot:6287247-Alexandrium_andersonii.AAC.1
MSASLVGSEMCIRDSSCTTSTTPRDSATNKAPMDSGELRADWEGSGCGCLLYTSDAADDM